MSAPREEPGPYGSLEGAQLDQGNEADALDAALDRDLVSFTRLQS